MARPRLKGGCRLGNTWAAYLACGRPPMIGGQTYPLANGHACALSHEHHGSTPPAKLRKPMKTPHLPSGCFTCVRNRPLAALAWTSKLWPMAGQTNNYSGRRTNSIPLNVHPPSPPKPASRWHGILCGPPAHLRLRHPSITPKRSQANLPIDCRASLPTDQRALVHYTMHGSG